MTVIFAVIGITLGSVPLLPGVPAFTMAWFINIAMWTWGPLLFGPAVGGLAAGLGGWIQDIFSGAPPFSLNCLIRTIFIGMVMVRLIGQDPDKAFTSAKKWVLFIIFPNILFGVLFANIGWIAQMSLLNLAPADLLYYACILSPACWLYMIFGQIILGVIITKLLAGPARRYSLLSVQRHVPRKG
jgi:uncharacterized membrane protein